MCLEVVIGITTTCLPVLKPIFVKVCDSMKLFSGKKGTGISWKSRSIPIFMRVSHTLASMSGKHPDMGEVDSTVPMEDSKRSESGGQSTAKVERVLGIKVCEVHVRRDILVESAYIEV